MTAVNANADTNPLLCWMVQSGGVGWGVDRTRMEMWHKLRVRPSSQISVVMYMNCEMNARSLRLGGNVGRPKYSGSRLTNGTLCVCFDYGSHSARQGAT